jgi:helix-turn-helix protein
MGGKEYSKIDHFLIRAKDVSFLLLATAGVFAWLSGWQMIPNRVEASEKEIQRVKEWEARTDTRLTVIEQDIKYLVKGIDEIKRKI